MATSHRPGMHPSRWGGGSGPTLAPSGPSRRVDVTALRVIVLAVGATGVQPPYEEEEATQGDRGDQKEQHHRLHGVLLPTGDTAKRGYTLFEVSDTG